MNPDSSSFYEVLDETTFPKDGMRIVKVRGRRVAIIKSAGKIHALDNDCPHVGGYLGQGTLMDNCVVCPLHQLPFDLDTGISPKGGGQYFVTVHEVKFEKGKIWVKFP